MIIKYFYNLFTHLSLQILIINYKIKQYIIKTPPHYKNERYNNNNIL